MLPEHGFAASESAPLPVRSFVEPFGAVAASLSPDGRHVALIEHHGTRHALKLVQLADQSSRVLMRGEWVRDGFNIVHRNPVAVSWINSQWLAVDFGYAAEAIDLQGKKVADLGTQVIGKAVPADPESTLMLVYDDEAREKVERVDVKTRRSVRLRYPMSGRPMHWTFDEKGELRALVLAESSFGRDDTALRLWYLPTGRNEWQQLHSWRIGEDFWQPLAASAQRDQLTVASRQGRDRWAIQRLDPLQPERAPEVVFEHPHEDVAPGESLRGAAPLSFVTLGLKPQRRWLDEAWSSVQRAVDQVLPGRINLLSGNPENQVLVFSYADTDPGRWYVLDAATDSLRLLAVARQSIDPARMRPMQALSYPAADGRPIPAYLTLPARSADRPDRPLATVVLVHGGPAARDHWAWDAEVQLLASRGYAVFQPQFRGSTGFGLEFERAGHGQWGLAMQDDITAGVRHLVEQGIADPARICIVGASYGGYAAVWGLIKTPDLYRCGVTLAGVADIGLMLTDGSDTNMNKMSREWQRVAVGDRQRDKATFDAVSPLRQAARLRAPLLIAHGEDDQRVPVTHAKKLKSALDAAGKPYEWLPLQGEGHSLRSVQAQQLYFERLLAFLERHIGSAPAAAAPR